MTTVDLPAGLNEVPAFEISLGNEQTEFSGTNRLLAEVAQEFGVILNGYERKDWQTLGRAAYIIDQHLDAEKNGLSDIAPRLFSGEAVPGIPQEFTNDCRQLLERQNAARQMHIWHQLERVKPLVDAQASAVSATEVVKIRLDEADLLADMLSLPTDGRPDKTERQKFNAWLSAFCRTGYLVDSIKDLEEDFESGASGVRPSFQAKRILGSAALREVAAATRIMTARQLGKCAMVAIRYELKKQKPDFSRPSEVI